MVVMVYKRYVLTQKAMDYNLPHGLTTCLELSAKRKRLNKQAGCYDSSSRVSYICNSASKLEIINYLVSVGALVLTDRKCSTGEKSLLVRYVYK